MDFMQMNNICIFYMHVQVNNGANEQHVLETKMDTFKKS